MKLIITDLQDLPFRVEGEHQVIGPGGGPLHPCTGCFGCWVRTPGRCVIPDGYQNTGIAMSRCDRLILVSRCCYGSLSPFVKGVLDRAISYVHPDFVFRDGEINYENLEKLRAVTGRERLVLDLSCRNKEGEYYIVTDRWQKFTGQKLDEALLERLSGYADEFLVHAVDVEGKARGIEGEVAQILGNWGKMPITYAGGIGSFADLEELGRLGKGKLNFTVGSALDLFGGDMGFEEVVRMSSAVLV